MKISAKKYAQGFYEAVHEADSADKKEVIRKFVALLSKQNALSQIEGIIKAYDTHAGIIENRKVVKVTVAHELSSSEKKVILEELTKRFKSEVILEVNVDKTLIGGAIVRFSDTVIDGSIKGSIADLKISLSS